MKKAHLAGLATVIVLAFCATVTSAAFAEEPVWLINGELITSSVESTLPGEFKFEDMKATGGAVAVNCTEIWHIIELPLGLTEVVEVLTLAGVAITKTAPLSCPFVTKGGCEGTAASVYPIDLPFHDQLVHSIGPWGLAYRDTLLEWEPTKPGLPGWVAECKTIIGNVIDTCKGETGSKVKNAVGGATLEFLSGATEEDEAISPGVTCSLGGEKAGLLSSPANALTSSSGTISITEP